MPSTAPLDLYIRRALGKPEADVFSRSDHMPPPTLMKGQVNHILFFSGCFNPPHEGHKAALCHGFFRGGKGIRLIAAIILPADDESVAEEYGRGNAGTENHVLTMQERINLINNSGLHGGWHWCYPHGAAGCGAFMGQLISEAAHDDFDIQFVTLTGPDHVGHECDDRWFHGPAVQV